MGKEKLAACVGTLLLLSGGIGTAVGGVVYPDPPGGWAYTYTGDAAAVGSNPTSDTRCDFDALDALDGTWGHSNGSDNWDGTYTGDGDNQGGVKAENGYLRIADRRSTAPNAKMYFAHDLGPQGGTDTMLDTGVTISFRGRLSPGLTGWAEGAAARGLEVRNSGKCMWGISQKKDHNDGTLPPDDGRGERIAFGLVTGVEHANLGGKSGLIMNRGGSTIPTRNVDTDDPMPPDTLRILEMPAESLTDWHEFWITIVADNKAGNEGGTHRVDIYLDGSLTPQSFWVSVGAALNEYPNVESGDVIWRNTLEMGSSRTGNKGAFDTDFFSWAPGVIVPVPEPVTLGLLAIGGLALLRRRR